MAETTPGLSTPPGGELTPEQQMLLQQQFMAALGLGERGGYTEMLRRTEALEVRHDVRMFANLMEFLWWKTDIRPNDYLINYSLIPGLKTRAMQLKFSIPLGFSEYSKDDKNSGLRERKGDRKALIEECERAIKEIQARRIVIEKSSEQEAFSSDVKAYLEDAFLRLGKILVDAENYGVIFSLPETYPGFAEYGAKVEAALGFWKKVAEGKATIDVKIKLKNGKEEIRRRYLPNPFALPRYEELHENIIDLYVVPQLEKRNPATLGKGEDPVEESEALDAFEELDNYFAAVTALLLIEHFDLDVKWSIGKVAFRLGELTEDELNQLTLELGFKDSGKLYTEVRRLAEYTGLEGSKKRREHPRKIGNPYTLGCYPTFMGSFIDIVSTEVLAKVEGGHGPRMAKQILAGYASEITKRKVDPGRISNSDPFISKLSNDQRKELDSRLKKDGFRIDLSEVKTVGDLLARAEYKEIGISIADQVWSGGKVTRLDGDTPIEYTFKPKRFRDILWDKIGAWEIVDAEVYEQVDLMVADLAKDRGEIKPLEYASGVRSDAFEVPYKLQGFYAHKFFDLLMRADYASMYKEVISTDLLVSMNKAIDLALILLANAYNLDGDTVENLGNYIRVVWLGSLGAANVGLPNLPIDRDAQVAYPLTLNPDTVVKTLGDIARKHAFLPVDREGNRLIKQDYKALFEKIVKREYDRVPRPSEVILQISGKPLFSKAQIETLKALYPFGA